jgi:hypothetical protein
MHCLLFLLLMITLSVGIGQQPSSLDNPLTVSTREKLEEMIGGKSEAQRIIKDILATRLTAEAGQKPGGTPRVVLVVAEQLPEAWLPVVRGIRFERLPLNEARPRWEGGCLSLLRVSGTKAGDTLKVTITQGNLCLSVGGDYLFDRTPKGWVARSGIGSGFAGATAHCPCGPVR